MIARLRAIFDQAEQLSEQEQEALATQWEEQLAEAQWEERFNDPRAGSSR